MENRYVEAAEKRSAASFQEEDMKNYNTKEFLRIKRGYEQAALLLAQGKYKPALTALKRPIHSLEYGSEKTLFLAKCYELEAQIYEKLEDHERSDHYRKEARKIESQISG